jgi:hypothetical protein
LTRSWPLALIASACLALTGCDGCGADTPPTATPSRSNDTAEVTVPCEPGANGACLQPSVTRLTPEQVSNRIMDAFGHRLSYKDDEGYVYDEIINGYGVPLGGLDFVTADRRDPTIKVSTLLVAHAVAWMTASEIVWLDYEHREESGVWLLFTECDPEWDTPAPPEFEDPEDTDEEEIATRATRWAAQLDNLYWRAFSRAPTAEEVMLYQELFMTIANSEEDDPFIWGWMGVIYTMLSTVEFWTA